MKEKYVKIAELEKEMKDFESKYEEMLNTKVVPDMIQAFNLDVEDKKVDIRLEYSERYMMFQPVELYDYSLVLEVRMHHSEYDYDSFILSSYSENRYRISPGIRSFSEENQQSSIIFFKCFISYYEQAQEIIDWIRRNKDIKAFSKKMGEMKLTLSDLKRSVNEEEQKLKVQFITETLSSTLYKDLKILNRSNRTVIVSEITLEKIKDSLVYLRDENNTRIISTVDSLYDKLKEV